MIIMTGISAKIPHLIIAVGLGVMAGVGVADAWGAMERHRCKGLAETHQELALRNFWGTVTYCVDRRYL